MTAWLAATLLLLGCVLALLEWRLSVPDPAGYGIDLARLTPLVILVALVPLALPLRHVRHPWPSWLSPVALELAAGWLGYVLLFHLLPRAEPAAAGPWASWWVTALSLGVLWLVSVGVAAAAVAAVQSLWRPELGAVCPHCGYPLRGLRDDRCPECGRPLSGAARSDP